MKTKSFNCVEMKQKGASNVEAIISKFSKLEEIAFWQKGTTELTHLKNKLADKKNDDIKK